MLWWSHDLISPTLLVMIHTYSTSYIQGQPISRNFMIVEPSISTTLYALEEAADIITCSNCVIGGFSLVLDWSKAIKILCMHFLCALVKIKYPAPADSDLFHKSAS